MKVNPENLVKISTYAREKDVSTACVYLWIRNKEINTVTIDGVIFVVKDELSAKKGKGVKSDAPSDPTQESKKNIEY